MSQTAQERVARLENTLRLIRDTVVTVEAAKGLAYSALYEWDKNASPASAKAPATHPEAQKLPEHLHALIFMESCAGLEMTIAEAEAAWQRMEPSERSLVLSSYKKLGGLLG